MEFLTERLQFYIGGGGVGGSGRGALWTLKLKSAGIRLSLEGCLNEQPKILAERLELVFD